jgi:two-component system, NarL family, response regulator NreC
MTRIMVVDDHEIVRDALAGLLGETPGLEVVGVASSIREAVPMLERSAPDLVLADLSLGDGSATELVRALRRARLKGRVIIITGFNDEFAAAEALAAGASGYVLKSQATAELLEAIRTVASGRQYVAPLIATRLSGRLGEGEGNGEQEGSLGLERLSRRELEIFRLVVAGYPSKEVARRLCISVKTVETHRTNMNRKLAVRTTADLIRFAVAHGIVVAPRVFPEDVIDASHPPPPAPIKDPVVIPVDYGDGGAPAVRPRS